MNDSQALINLLQVEQIEHNIFRGQNSHMGSPAVFGGQVLAQALNAATRTVAKERLVHSLHAYFILPGDLSKPIIYEVDRIRDGRSFATRRVVAIQHGKAIFNLAASFQLKQEGCSHQNKIPKVPLPENLLNVPDLLEKYGNDWPPMIRQFFLIERPIEFRPVEWYDPLNTGKQPARKHVWMRAKGQVLDNQALHTEILAYASDYNLLSTAMLPHGDHANFFNTQLASLDHAMYFHRNVNMNEWLLYAIESPSASNARGFCRGQIFSQDGTLIASVTQEGLMRKRW